MGRQLEPALEKLIETKLLQMMPAAYQKAIREKNGNELVAQANEALAAMKVREKTGKNDGYIVSLLQETIGKAEQESWCMAEQQSCIAFAEKKTGLKSKVPATESTITCATDCPPALKRPLKNSTRGCIWIWQHGKKWKGHTGCDMGNRVKGLAHLIEGNTNQGSIGGKIVREGGGTYDTLRTFGTIGDMTPIACIKPF